MDISKYEVFLNAVDRGGFNKISEDSGYTQSAISKMMNSMEKEIGFPLIVRNNKGITLTPEGEQVLPMIRLLVNVNKSLEEEYDLLRGVERGKIRIGSFPTIAFAWMPGVLKKFQQEHPNIYVEVIEENHLKQLELWLNQGIIDIALFTRQSYHTYGWKSLMKDQYVALLPEDHKLAKKEIVPVKDLLRENVILFRSQEGIDKDIAAFIDKVNVKVNVNANYATNSDFTVMRMVEQNGYVTILPKLIAEYAVTMFDVVCRPMDVVMHRELGIAVKDADRISPSVRKFIEYAEQNTTG